MDQDCHDRPHPAGATVSGPELPDAALTDVVPLSDFLGRAEGGPLAPEQRVAIVAQAIGLLSGFYVNLPAKRSLYAVNPVRRLELLLARLRGGGMGMDDLAFHREMHAIMSSTRDLHTNYLLPAPFKDRVAFLPFRVEEYFDHEDARRLVVSSVDPGGVPPCSRFRPGVEVVSWSGVPIERAVELLAGQHAGANLAARHARGLARLTLRALTKMPPPDEHWVAVGFRGEDGSRGEVRLEWRVGALPPEAEAGAASPDTAWALADDLESEAIGRAWRGLLAKPAVAAPARSGRFPEMLEARAVRSGGGEIGHVRIRSFRLRGSATPRQFVDEFVRLAADLPQDGLVLDIRDNGGGSIEAAETLLQVLTPRPVEPASFQLICSPQTLALTRARAADGAGGAMDLARWAESVQRAVEETGSAHSAGFRIRHDGDYIMACNEIGQRYYGPVVLVASALSYSAADLFAAGFQDHGIGPVLGTHERTGGGGANVVRHQDVLGLLERVPDTDRDAAGLRGWPRPLGGGAGLRVALRRALRVRGQAGVELEDSGVRADEVHRMTKNDLLRQNEDLMESAAALIADKRRTMPVLRIEEVVAERAGYRVRVRTANLDRLEAYLDGRPLQRWVDLRPDGDRATLTAPKTDGGDELVLQGSLSNCVVAKRVEPLRAVASAG